jgi:hypothetical protein
LCVTTKLRLAPFPIDVAYLSVLASSVEVPFATAIETKAVVAIAVVLVPAA